MKQILVIILCFISFASSMMADEKEDSLNYYFQRYYEADQSRDYHKACINLREVLRIYKSINGDVHRDTIYAKMLVLYAKCCFNINDDETTTNIDTEISDIYKAVYGVNTLQYVQSINSLAGFYSGFGKYKEAIRLVSEALGIQKKTIGEEHPDYAMSLAILANYYFYLGDYAKAIELGAQALEIRKKTLGEEHPDYDISLNNLAVYYSALGNYAKAIELCSHVLEIQKKTLGEEHPDYANSLGNLSKYYSDLGGYAKAIELCSKALEIRKKKLGEDHPNYATLLANLSTYYSKLGNYTKAIELDSQALEIQKKTLGEEHPNYANSLANLANYYCYLGNYAKAVELGAQALEIRKKTIGEEHPDYATSLNNLANCYSNLGDYTKAIELGSHVLEIQKKTLGEEHPAYALSLANLADYYYDLGNYSKAIELDSQALEIKKKTLGEEHPNYANSLGNLSKYYSDLGNYSKAIELGSHVLEIQKKTLGEEHPAYARTLANLAGYYSDLGDYTKAIELGSHVLEIQKKTLGEEHPDYANSLANLAKYYCYLGNYAKAIELGAQALEIQKKTLGEEHPNYATSLNNLANCYSNLGDYTKAIELGSHVLEIQKKTLGEEHPDYANSLGNLANYYSALGGYAKAIELCSQALEILKKTLGEEHPNYANSLGNLSKYYSDLGGYAKAIELGSQALEIRKKTLGEEHPNYATSLNNLANCYSNLGDYTKAIELCSQALEIEKKTIGEEHPDYATSLNNLANCYSNLGDYTKAIELGSQALEIRKKTLGEEHPDYATLLANLACYYDFLNDYKVSIQLFEKYITIVRNNVLNIFSQLISNERQMYWNKYSFTFNAAVPRVIVNSDAPSSSSLLYDNVALFSKGLLLSTELEMSKLIQERGDDEAEQMYSELRQNRQILNAQYSKPIAERYIGCDSLERVSNELERKLVIRVEEFGDFTKNLSITWKDVQSKLDDSDIAIEYLSYPENDSTVAYVALTLCQNDTAPVLTPLFTSLQLKEVAGEDSTYQNAAADSLIWGPLSSRLEGKSRIYFSAAGMLHRIGIEYLPSMEGKECYRLSSTRELVTHKPSEAIKSATLFGGIDYDATYASIKSPAPSSTPSDQSAPSTILYAENTEVGPIIYKQGGRGGLDEYNSMRSMRYSVDSLPGSRKEIQAISGLLKESCFNIQKCDTITRNQASEESFKGLSGQRKSLIHISTHGFYYDVDEAKNKGEHLRLMLMGDNRPSRSEDKSLLRCGLCFAGANQFLREMNYPADGQDEGILNALEIAQTDLRGLDLVVLSACQTALGDVVNGEGVFGLQRGFKKAGTRSILMSLWKVDDDITALLMTEFYRAWSSTPDMTKAGALKAAQDSVKKKYPNPHDWAGFILLDALD